MNECKFCGHGDSVCYPCQLQQGLKKATLQLEMLHDQLEDALAGQRYLVGWAGRWKRLAKRMLVRHRNAMVLAVSDREGARMAARLAGMRAAAWKGLAKHHRAAQRQTQHWLEQFQGSTASETVRALQYENETAQLRAELEAANAALTREWSAHAMTRAELRASRAAHEAALTRLTGATTVRHDIGEKP